MKLTDKRRLDLIAKGDLVSIKGREFIALDALDTPVELAAPEPEATRAVEQRPEQRRERKADVEGTAGSS